MYTTNDWEFDLTLTNYKFLHTYLVFPTPLSNIKQSISFSCSRLVQIIPRPIHRPKPDHINNQSPQIYTHKSHLYSIHAERGSQLVPLDACINCYRKLQSWTWNRAYFVLWSNLLKIFKRNDLLQEHLFQGQREQPKKPQHISGIACYREKSRRLLNGRQSTSV